MGLAHVKNSKFHEAYKVLSDCLPFARASWSDRHVKTITCKRFLSIAAFYRERFEQAATLVEESIIHGNDISAPLPLLIQLNNSLAEYEQRLGRFAKAEDRLKRMVKLVDELGRRDSITGISSVRLLGRFYLTRSQNELAKPFLSEVAARASASIRDRIMYSICLWELGESNAAETLLNRTVASLGETPQASADLAFGYEIQALIRRHKGELDAVLELNKKTLAIRKQIFGEKHYATLESACNLALTFDSVGRHKEGQASLRKAIEHFEEIKLAPAIVARRKLQLAESLTITNDLDEAELLTKECLQHFENDQASDHHLASLLVLANIKIIQNQLDSAKGLLLKASNLKINSGVYPIIDHSRALASLGDIAIRQSEPSKAREYYSSALKTVTNLEDSIVATDSAYVQIAAKNVHSKRLLNGLMLAVAEYRTTPAQLAKVYSLVIDQKCSVSDRQRFQRCKLLETANAKDFQKLVSLGNQIGSSFAAYEGKPNDEVLAHQLLDQRSALEKKLLANCPSFNRAFRPIRCEDIRNSLKPNEVFFDFIEYQSSLGKRTNLQIAVFVLHKNHPVKLLLIQDADRLQRSIHDWLEGQGESVKAQKAALNMREQLVKPLLAAMEKDVDEIIMCPTGLLASLPLGSLPGKNPKRFVIEDYVVSYQFSPRSQHSTGLTENAKTNPNSSQGLLILADPEFGTKDDTSLPFAPIPASRTECDEISRLFQATYSDAPSVLLGSSATKERFLARIQKKRPGFLHLATHAFVRAQEKEKRTSQWLSNRNLGQRTGIAFADANLSKGGQAQMVADEIVNLPMEGASLVVLSACNTASGNTISGANETNFSLRRSFLIAGAQTVMASAWSVPDHPTYQLMQKYYENLWSHKMSRAKALQAAKIWMLHNYHSSSSHTQRGKVVVKPVEDRAKAARASPYLWGAWTLTGNKDLVNTNH